MYLSGSEIMLRFAAALGPDAAFVAQQVDCFRKAKEKIPAFFDHDCYYTTKSLEQCTAEPVALYKKILIRGDKLLEICGGLGLDAWALSGNFKTILSVDPDETLNAIATYNYKKLGVNNITRITATAETFLEQNTEVFTTVYADPDRRPGNKRTGSLKDSLPDIISLLPALHSMAENIWIKVSPMYDISVGIKELTHVHHVYVIALKNEVKELLFHLKKDDGPVCVTAVNISADSSADAVHFELKGETLHPAYAWNGKYFFEPNTAIIKSGHYRHYAASLSLALITTNVPFFVSDVLPEKFSGRRFRINAVMPYNPRQLKQYFKSEGISRANVSVRGAEISPEIFYRMSGLKEGGETYIFITRNAEGSVLVYDCRKI